jgi:hypothetical protein
MAERKGLDPSQFGKTGEWFPKIMESCAAMLGTKGWLHHGCWKLCGDFEPGFDLMSGIYPKCPLPKVMAYHYMSEDGKCLLFKVKPVAEVEEDKA